MDKTIEQIPDPRELYAKAMLGYGKDPDFWRRHYSGLEEKKHEIWRRLEVNRTFFDDMDLEEHIKSETDLEKKKLWGRYRAIEKILCRGLKLL